LAARRIAPETPIGVRPRWAEQGEGTPLDVPGTELYRNNGKITFQLLLERFGVAGEGFQRIGAIIADIEANAWRKNEYAETPIVESKYRSLQEGFSLRQAPFNCYLSFFDAYMAI
jgi:hypothetical protein